MFLGERRGWVSLAWMNYVSYTLGDSAAVGEMKVLWVEGWAGEREVKDGWMKMCATAR